MRQSASARSDGDGDDLENSAATHGGSSALEAALSRTVEVARSEESVSPPLQIRRPGLLAVRSPPSTSCFGPPTSLRPRTICTPASHDLRRVQLVRAVASDGWEDALYGFE